MIPMKCPYVYKNVLSPSKKKKKKNVLSFSYSIGCVTKHETFQATHIIHLQNACLPHYSISYYFSPFFSYVLLGQSHNVSSPF